MKRFLTKEELDDRICNYCLTTERGALASVHTPNGVSMCEGSFCDEAYETYLVEEEEEEVE